MQYFPTKSKNPSFFVGETDPSTPLRSAQDDKNKLQYILLPLSTISLAFLPLEDYNKIVHKGGYLVKAWRHFCTITYHRWLVCRGCFRVGLYWQGLTHDLSKYSPTEFLVGARHYQGNRSPNAAEREEKGYSEAWMHHKGRNRHHYEYWSDLNRHTRRYEPVEMPRKYLAEMVVDRIAACHVYQRDAYRDDSPLNYFLKSMESNLMHPATHRQLGYILTMLRDEGEKATFHYIKHSVLKGKPFPWDETPQED